MITSYMPQFSSPMSWICKEPRKLKSLEYAASAKLCATEIYKYMSKHIQKWLEVNVVTVSIVQEVLSD